MSGPIKHSTTGLWVGGKKYNSGAEKRSYEYSCGWRAQWLLSKRTVTSGKQFGYQETAFFCLPSPFPNVNVRARQWARPRVPTSDSQNPNINSFLLLFCQQVWAGKFACKVVLSRMANKQSYCCTGWRTLQHFRHLFHLTACLTSAGCILLTQDSVSWTGIGACRDTMEAFLLFPVSSPSCEWTPERE